MSVQHPPPHHQQQQQQPPSQDSQRGNTRSIGNYILGRTIGEGTFGKVKLARHILSGASVAVKVLQKDRLVEVADVERVAREVHILKLLRHPHIAQLFEIIETRGQLYLVMEYASGGELFDYIVRKGRVPELEACRFFHQIIAGIERIHEMGVVHRDLKPENLLLDEHSRIKIADFGLSNVFREGQRLSTACGSPCYAPPEMVAGQQYVPHMCDLWSCGVILFALVCGFLPFEDQNTAELYKKILAADYAFPNFPSEAVKDLIAGLLTVDPTRRFTIAVVRAHPWYRQIPEASSQAVEPAPATCQSFDDDVLRELEAYGFPKAYAVRCLELNKHNHMTTTYWLLLERKQKIMEQIERALVDAAVLDGVPADAASQQAGNSAMEAVDLSDASVITPRKVEGACCYGVQVVAGATRVDHGRVASARAAPVVAWSPTSAAPVPAPAPSPGPACRTAVAQPAGAPVANCAVPGATKTSSAPDASSAAVHQELDGKCTAAGVVGGGGAHGPAGLRSAAPTTSTPTPAEHESSATPQTTPRVCGPRTQKAVITPRGQTLSPRAVTPQGAAAFRQVATQPCGPNRTPSPLRTVLPAAAAQPLMLNPNRPAAAVTTSVKVVAGTRTGPFTTWNPVASAPSAMPVRTPELVPRYPTPTTLHTRVPTPTTPRSTNLWACGPAVPTAAPQRCEGKSMAANSGCVKQVLGTIGVASPATVGGKPQSCSAEREPSATPQVTPRMYSTPAQAQKATLTPRAQTVTRRAITPQGTRPYEPQATPRAPSPVGTAPQAGVAACRPILTPRRPIAFTAMSVRVMSGASSARGTSRPTWK